MREIMIYSLLKNSPVTKNKMIMEYTCKYAKIEKIAIKELRIINYMRLFKRVFILLLLLGPIGRNETDAYTYEEVKCQI